MDKTYVDELPETRTFERDLSNLGSSSTAGLALTQAPTMTQAPTVTDAPTLRADVDFSVTTKAPKFHHHYRQHRTD